MPSLLETVNSIEARRPFSESDVTRFDERHPAYIYAPEPQPEQAMFTHNTELEVAASAQKAAEHATPADAFRLPLTPEDDAANQETYMAALTEKSNVVSLEDRRYANPEAALDESLNSGAAVEMIRNAA